MKLLFALLFCVGCGGRPDGSEPEKPAAAEASAPAAPPQGEETEGAPGELPKPAKVSSDAVIRSLTAENASLRRQISEGLRPDPYASLGLINAHEHLMSLKQLDRYLEAARRANIATTVFVASPEFTLNGKGEKGEPSMSENFEALLQAAAARPGEVIPFCTVDPKDPDKLERLKAHIKAGAKGVKLYSGHSNFKDGPLVDPGMAEVLKYLEETGIPLNWHINVPLFSGEFSALLDAFPKLNIMVPHYGVGFWQPRAEGMSLVVSMLRKHKNLYVDTSLGTREILIKGMAVMEQDLSVFNALFAEFPDQIIWGTDSVVTGNSEKTPSWYTDVIWATRDQLEREVFFTPLAAGYSKYYQSGRDGDGRYRGLNLPPEVLKKVYHDNPMRWLKLTGSPRPPVASGQVPAAPATESAPTQP